MPFLDPEIADDRAHRAHFRVPNPVLTCEQLLVLRLESVLTDRLALLVTLEARELERAGPTWIVVLYPETVPETRYAYLREQGFAPIETLEGWADWTNGDVVIWRRRD